jgi:phosphatidate cytidylyltransferase
MLKQRIFTALVLLIVLGAALAAASPWPLTALLTLAAASALWEWLRLTWRQPNTVFPVLIAAMLGLFFLWSLYGLLGATSDFILPGFDNNFVRWVLPLTALAWIVGASALVIQGQSQVRTGARLLSAFGVVAIFAVWFGLVALFLAFGWWFLLTLMATIWFADIGAYFTGKALGKHKLAPRVSPGKTWEGAIGGVLAATVWVLLSIQWQGSFGAVLADHYPVVAVTLIVVFLAALSIVGDLFESLLKRRAGVKDSSRLLPGHGGILDRIDALLPVVPVVYLLIVAA